MIEKPISCGCFKFLSVWRAYYERNGLVLFLEKSLNGKESSFGVGSIENGLNHDDVHSAIQKASSLFLVSLAQLVEG